MLNPNDIASKTFDKGMAGYKQDEVDSYLELVAKEMQALIEEKSVLENKIVVLADKIEEYREDEDSLKAALVGAQKLGETVIREAKEKADKIQRESAKKAEFIIADAKNAVEREQTALENIQKEVAVFKERLIETYRQHVEMINNLADFGPKSKKASQEVIEAKAGQATNETTVNAEGIESFNNANFGQEEFSDIKAEPIITKFEPEVISKTPQGNFAIGEDFTDNNEINGESATEPTMSFKPPINDSKFGPLKFGDEYEVKRDADEVASEIKNKTFFRKERKNNKSK